ncbi:glycogen/starch synthase, partial [Akkermansiaceae bacterium]|nr:glycogen/starch synthase [Akkermansiaceae bacterium]
MRIALVSFEFPPAIAIGGIGTYAWEAATMLAQGGHKVEVFSAGKKGPEPAEEFGIKVHRFDADDRA